VDLGRRVGGVRVKTAEISDMQMVKWPWPDFYGPLLGTGALRHEHCCLTRHYDARRAVTVFEWGDH
jgi:hypothetical protein